MDQKKGGESKLFLWFCAVQGQLIINVQPPEEQYTCLVSLQDVAVVRQAYRYQYKRDGSPILQHLSHHVLRSKVHVSLSENST